MLKNSILTEGKQAFELTLCDLEGTRAVETILCLTKICAALFVVRPGASGGE